MGQIASLFSLNEQDFQQLETNPTSFDFSQAHLVSEGFNKTFEGLRFVLSQGQNAETTALIEQIFNPWSFVGEEVDYSAIDWEDASFDESLFDAPQPIHFSPPETVDAIAAFLVTITEEEFRQAFNPDELNQAKVYPSGVWNDSTSLKYGYNAVELVEGFHLLQSFFGRIKNGNNYCICLIN